MEYIPDVQRLKEISLEEIEKAIEEADRISATLTDWPDVDNYVDDD